jgi:hypothetical protein
MSVQPIPNSLNHKKFVLGVDVGGTSIKSKLYEIVDGKIAGDGVDVFAEKIDTRKGFSAHRAQVQDIFSQAAQKAVALDGALVAIGVGMPGRFRNGQILDNTATQLDAVGDDMYHKNIQQEYERALPDYLKRQNITISVHNDADMMLTGVLKAIENGEAMALDQDGNTLNSVAQFAPKVTGLLGLGTGVGNSFMFKDTNGASKFVTDGHASKLLIRVDDEDLPLLSMAENNNVQVLKSEDGRVRAEDLFKDGTFNAIAGIASAKDFNPEIPVHQKAATFAGKYMARTIEAIASGESEDITGQGWSDADKRDAAKADAYIISGGLGQGYLNEDGTKDEKKSSAGQAIIAAAVKELELRSQILAQQGNTDLSQKLDSIQIAQFTGSTVAEKSAAETALSAYLSKQKSI